MTRLVALDLDGTLLSGSTELPTAHERVVRELRQQGSLVAIATGRPLLTARWIWDRLHLDTPMACFNGAWVGVPGAKPIAESALPERDVRDILAELTRHDGAICCYPQADRWVIDRESGPTAGWRERYRADFEVDPRLASDWRGSSFKVMFVTAGDQLRAVFAGLRQRFADRFHICVSEYDRLEISRAGVTKAWGLERLARHLGCEQAEVWAVGDAENDLEMIAWAGHGCAMGHACERVRCSARHVLPGIHARGLCALPGLLARHAPG
nr:HAD family phosphatase [Planctomycetota bacterium]